ncbi:MAG: aromatic aminobenezylarsenical efflux permease ArsG family transporter [bacterium]
MIIAIGSALWFGILTSISPCPLATNIAAISFISGRLSSNRQIIGAGLAYTLGRMAAYLVVGIIIIAGLLSIPIIANALQKYLNIILGPILIIVGMILLELIKMNFPGFSQSGKLESSVERGGILGAGVLGFLFGLSFCPVSAALFFGSLIPLALEHESRFLLPMTYGFGTALPVVIFAFIIAFSMKSLAGAFNSLKIFEFWARRITGIAFIAIGIYYALTYIFGLSF